MKDIKFPLPQNTSCWLIYETNSLLNKIGFKNMFIKKKKSTSLYVNKVTLP